MSAPRGQPPLCMCVPAQCALDRCCNCRRLQTRTNFEEMSKQTESLMKKMMEVRQMVSVTSLLLYDVMCCV